MSALNFQPIKCHWAVFTFKSNLCSSTPDLSFLHLSCIPEWSYLTFLSLSLKYSSCTFSLQTHCVSNRTETVCVFAAIWAHRNDVFENKCHLKKCYFALCFILHSSPLWHLNVVNKIMHALCGGFFCLSLCLISTDTGFSFMFLCPFISGGKQWCKKK